jgi:hypothetical protein
VIIQYGREVMGRHKVSQVSWDRAPAQLGPKKRIRTSNVMGYYMMLGLALIGTFHRCGTLDRGAILHCRLMVWPLMVALLALGWPKCERCVIVAEAGFERAAGNAESTCRTD